MRAQIIPYYAKIQINCRLGLEFQISTDIQDAHGQ